MSVHVKICGLTQAADVAAAVAAGADSLGFNLATGPRRLAPEQAAELVRLVPTDRGRVALFVDASEAEILAAMAVTGCNTVQLHGDEPPDLAERLAGRFRVIKACRVRGAAALDELVGYPAHIYLLDTCLPGQAGGTGVAWDHQLLAGRDLGRPVLLAGGLTPANVAAAIAAARPWGVDVSSGVEDAVPGRKDPAKLRDFIAAAKCAGRASDPA
jgi:phosphoribosylanthranilate isomerase